MFLMQDPRGGSSKHLVGTCCSRTRRRSWVWWCGGFVQSRCPRVDLSSSPVPPSHSESPPPPPDGRRTSELKQTSLSPCSQRGVAHITFPVVSMDSSSCSSVQSSRRRVRTNRTVVRWMMVPDSPMSVPPLTGVESESFLVLSEQKQKVCSKKAGKIQKSKDMMWATRQFPFSSCVFTVRLNLLRRWESFIVHVLPTVTEWIIKCVFVVPSRLKRTAM